MSEALAKATAAVTAQRTSVSNRHAVRTPHTHASVGSVAVKKKKMDQKQRWLPGILPRQGISSPWLCLADSRWAASGRSETAWVQTAAPGAPCTSPSGCRFVRQPVPPHLRPSCLRERGPSRFLQTSPTWQMPCWPRGNTSSLLGSQKGHDGPLWALQVAPSPRPLLYFAREHLQPLSPARPLHAEVSPSFSGYFLCYDPARSLCFKL